MLAKGKDAAVLEANISEAGLTDKTFEIRSKASSPVPRDSQYQRTADTTQLYAELYQIMCMPPCT